jgi:hypothetical protein
MRLIRTAPLAAAILLAACGGDADTDGDGEVNAGEVAAEASGMVQPRPGQYRVALELMEFDIPGMSESDKQQMQQIFGSGLAEGNTFCMTEADVAENGAEQMVRNLAESDCTMNSFDVSGGTVTAEMQCLENGAASTVKLDGQMTADGSTMTMERVGDVPNVGQTRMKMKVTSERIGDCAA